ncbi:MAG: DUF456 domain-containing protein [Planctomycetaceae bacterium]|nr:DUF456 domain-containing protein [Planctomycetaceae bacterium]
MEHYLVYLALVLLMLLNAFWLMLVLVTVPGNWMMVISTYLFAWWRWQDGFFGWALLATITVLALIGELIEFFAGAGGARRAGATWKGAIAAILGAVFGGLSGTFVIPVPLFGTLIGACFGAGLMTWIVERHSGSEKEKSLRSGIGAGTGVLIGTLSKFTIGCIIWIIILIAAIWN